MELDCEATGPFSGAFCVIGMVEQEVTKVVLGSPCKEGRAPPDHQTERSQQQCGPFRTFLDFFRESYTEGNPQASDAQAAGTSPNPFSALYSHALPKL